MISARRRIDRKGHTGREGEKQEAGAKTHEYESHDRAQRGDGASVDREDDEFVHNRLGALEARARALEVEDKRARNREIRHHAEHVEHFL